MKELEDTVRWVDYRGNIVQKWQQETGRSGWLADQPEGEHFILGAHNASVKGAPKVFLSIFVTDD